MRPICKACNRRPAAVNCYHGDKVYYRSRCDPCIRRAKNIRPVQPRWKTAGYKKKEKCDRCGFRAKFAAQLVVHHVDGDLNHCELRNLKTVCLNCIEEIKRLDLPWKPGDLEPDL
jgi:hypothetical protein